MQHLLRLTVLILALAALGGCMTPPAEPWPSSAQGYTMPPFGMAGASYGECWHCAGFYQHWE